MASTVLQALEETHTHLAPTAPLSPLAGDTTGSGGESATDADETTVDEGPAGPVLISQPMKLRNAQIHLLGRLALLLLRPSARELEDAKRFVAFFLFGTTNPQCLQPLVEQEAEHSNALAYTAATETQNKGNTPPAAAAAAAVAAAAAAAEISALITPRSVKVRSARNA
eukprot:COSAG02_NODE_6921_length_3286_cov_11.638700_3_plen_169_part_00